MPFADPEKRKIYHRAYQRRRRAQQGLTSNPDQTPQAKAYICWRHPQLRLPGIAFKNGLYVTARIEEQAQIERGPLYGSDVFAWRLDP
jgi:hypothetical protein